MAVRVENLTSLGDLYCTAAREAPGDLPGGVHRGPPIGATDGAGRIRRAGAAARTAVAGQCADRRVESALERTVTQRDAGGVGVRPRLVGDGLEFFAKPVGHDVQ